MPKTEKKRAKKNVSRKGGTGLLIRSSIPLGSYIKKPLTKQQILKDEAEFEVENLKMFKAINKIMKNVIQNSKKNVVPLPLTSDEKNLVDQFINPLLSGFGSGDHQPLKEALYPVVELVLDTMNETKKGGALVEAKQDLVEANNNTIILGQKFTNKYAKYVFGAIGTIFLSLGMPLIASQIAALYIVIVRVSDKNKKIISALGVVLMIIGFYFMYIIDTPEIFKEIMADLGQPEGLTNYIADVVKIPAVYKLITSVHSMESFRPAVSDAMTQFYSNPLNTGISVTTGVKPNSGWSTKFKAVLNAGVRYSFGFGTPVENIREVSQHVFTKQLDSILLALKNATIRGTNEFGTGFLCILYGIIILLVCRYTVSDKLPENIQTIKDEGSGATTAPALSNKMLASSTAISDKPPPQGNVLIKKRDLSRFKPRK